MIVVDGAERVRVVAESNAIGILELVVGRLIVEENLPRVDETRHVHAERVRSRQASNHLARLLTIDVYGAVRTTHEQVVQVGVETIGSFGVQLDDGSQGARLVVEFANHAVRGQRVREMRAVLGTADHVAKVMILVVV